MKLKVTSLSSDSSSIRGWLRNSHCARGAGRYRAAPFGSKAARLFTVIVTASLTLTGCDTMGKTNAETSTSIDTSAMFTSWPDASNTGTVNCPPLEKVNNSGDTVILQDNTVFENKELLNPGAIVIRGAHNVTIRCVKLNGTGWFGIDNTDRPSPTGTYTDVIVDQVDISCQDKGQVIGMLLKAATITRANVHNCDHMLNVGGDNVIIQDSYCHDLTDLPVVHADCIQSTGGVSNIRIEHNALWSRDTSDILLGQEYGDATNVVINNNRLMSMGSPPPAYLLYLSGTNTVVTNNRFTRRFNYGHCTLNTSNPVTWTNNVWDDDGTPIPLKDCSAKGG